MALLDINLDALSPAELEEKRRAFLRKAEELGGYDKLPDEDLHQWCAISNQLRKGKAGPPRAKKEKVKKEPKSIEDLF